MAEMMQHLTALADEIGPRPATSDAESRAAAYIESVFVARGLEPEIQEFEAPRTYSWAFVIYHLLTIVAAVCRRRMAARRDARLGRRSRVSAIVAFFMWIDLDTRWGLTRLMPKGPSQNVIARHIPKSRRGEKLKKVVIVAHYDTRARLARVLARAWSGSSRVTFALMKACTFAVPVLLLVDGAADSPCRPCVDTVPLVRDARGVAAYLLIPLLINVHRELAMPFVAGANDNASGVAAMLGVLHNLVPEPDVVALRRPRSSSRCAAAPRRRSKPAWCPRARCSRTRPPGGATPSTELPDDFAWAEPDRRARAPAAARPGACLEFETIEFARGRPDATKPRREADRRTARERREPRRRLGRAPPPTGSRRDATSLGVGEPPRTMDPTPEAAAQAQGLLGGLGLGRKKKDDEDADVKGWLGVDDEFDARKAGKEIGSWDSFGRR